MFKASDATFEKYSALFLHAAIILYLVNKLNIKLSSSFDLSSLSNIFFILILSSSDDF